MEITEVRIKLMEEPGERLKAFCSITFDDCFVVRDLKIIEGTSGPFVAMPSRKLTSHCQRCGMKNHLRAAYCNQCGAQQEEGRAPKDADGRAKLYADIAHPINSDCREMIQERVIRRVFTRKSSGRSSRATFRATTISISNMPRRRARNRHASIRRMANRRRPHRGIMPQGVHGSLRRGNRTATIAAAASDAPRATASRCHRAPAKAKALAPEFFQRSSCYEHAIRARRVESLQRSTSRNDVVGCAAHATLRIACSAQISKSAKSAPSR